MAPWPSGKAKVCNTSIPGPIPGGASKKKSTPKGAFLFGRATHEEDRAFVRLRTKTGSQIRRKDVPCSHGNSSENLARKASLPGGVPKRVPIFFGAPLLHRTRLCERSEAESYFLLLHSSLFTNSAVRIFGREEVN